jgi:Na+/melibiose symporter-like transporter
MTESEISKERRNFVRKGSILFAILFCPIVTFGFFNSVSGPFYVSICFYSITLISAIYISYLWSCCMWKIYEKRIIRACEAKAMRERKLRPSNTVDHE